MARLVRPYIPLHIRCQVAARQADAKGFRPSQEMPVKLRLRLCLTFLFGDVPVHLDHNPPLMLRRKVYDNNGRFIRYIPDANDPDFLIYRTVEGHKIKTLVRGDGAQRSDVSQRRYLKRVAKNRKPKRKRKWPSRKFPKRKLRLIVCR